MEALTTPPDLSRIRAWLLATRPKTLIASVAPVIAGTGLAIYHGVFAFLPALAALLGAICIQIGTNIGNDYYDFVRGGDTEDRVGPVRVTQAGILPPKIVRAGMLAALGLAIVLGVYLVWSGGWPIVWIGLASIACAVLYTGGPFPLAYHVLGDLFVFIFFGLVAVAGTYYVQGLSWSADAFLIGAGVGALNTALIVVNNLRDIETDARAGKRTLAVRIGRTLTKLEYLLMLMISLLVPRVGWMVLSWPVAVLCSLLVIPLSVSPAKKVIVHVEARDLLPALAETAQLVGVYGLALAAGFALG
ncbi:MAG: 1,4-dihydroxy-2-naphthoate polyprenyltransferase [Gemmatimonadetes bacterium]|nr:1,4-dihydroxy-2-naphthoate polyprenyltransferase [Gemmatimonadota bacterium]